jgi:hypothetical protein
MLKLRKQGDRTQVEIALIRLRNKNLALTKDNIVYIMDLKPTNISNNRWWAMLNSVRKEDLG